MGTPSTASDDLKVARKDIALPRSWRRRSWLLAAAGLAPFVPIFFVTLAPNTGALWWILWAAWSVSLLLIMLCFAKFGTRQAATFDPSDPVLKDIEVTDDDMRWTGPINALDATNFAETITQAAKIYPRLQVRAIAAHDLSADLETKAGWSTPGTDISMRVLPTGMERDQDNVAPAAQRQFRVTNTAGYARMDELQSADDLSRLVYLLRELAPQHIPGHAPSSSP